MTDGFVAKYNGTLLPSNTSFLIWGFRFGGTGADMVEGSALAAAGNFVISGKIDGTTAIDMNPAAAANNIIGSGLEDLFVAKYDGTLLPSAVGFYKWAFSAGAANNDVALGVEVDAAGMVYVAGGLAGAVDMDPSTGVFTPVTGGGSVYDIFQAKYDGNLTPSSTSFFKWAYAITTGLVDVGTDLALQAADRVVMTGYKGAQGTDMDPSTGGSLDAGGMSNDAFVMKVDGSLLPSDLNFFQWGRGYGDGLLSTSNNDVVSDDSGNSYVMGSLYGTFDADVGPGVFAIETRASSAPFVAKYNSSGALVWAFTLDPDKYRRGANLTPLILEIDDAGNIYIGGRFDSGLIDPDPSSNNDTITSSLWGDFFIAKYDGTKTPSDPNFYQWAFSIQSQGPGLITPGSIAVGGDGTVYVSGSLKDGVEFDPSAGTYTVPAGAADRPFIASYNGNLLPSDPAFFKWQFFPAGPRCWGGGRLELDAAGYLYYAGEAGANSFDMDPSANISLATGAGNALFVCKYDPAFPPTNTSFFKWGSFTSAFSAFSQNTVKDLKLDPVGKIYVCGTWLSATVDMDPSTNVNSLTGSSPGDIFLVSYDGNYAPSSTSFYRWSFVAGSSTNLESAFSMAVDAAGDVYLTGSSGGTVTYDLDPSGGTANVTPLGSDDIFVAKYHGELDPSIIGFCDFGFLVGGTGMDKGFGVDVIPTGQIEVVGVFNGSIATLDFDPTATAYMLHPTTTSSNILGHVVQYATTMGIPLAASEIVLTARPDGNGVDLNWNYTGQSLSARYEVERSAGSGFESVHSTKSLSWLDNDVPSGAQIYYRIKGFDPSGTVAYSNVVTLHTASDSQVAAFPNPTSDRVEVVADGQFDFKLLTLTGQLIQTGEAENHCTLDLANLPNGIYLLLVNGNSLKLVKE